MPVTYKKLWKLLIDKEMKKKDLQKEAELTAYAMNKLSRNEAVSTDILVKVCKCFNCTVDDIMEIVPDEDE